MVYLKLYLLMSIIIGVVATAYEIVMSPQKLTEVAKEEFDSIVSMIIDDGVSKGRVTREVVGEIVFYHAPIDGPGALDLESACFADGFVEKHLVIVSVVLVTIAFGRTVIFWPKLLYDKVR